jgi:3',5'-cyclic AMP phosphodiesterase CpdA
MVTAVAGTRSKLRVVHVSDLHLGATVDQRSAILAPLVGALRDCRKVWGGPPALLAITGDLFDSPNVDVTSAIGRFLDLLAELREALGGEVPTLLIPGNHDRRTQGLLLPYRPALMEALGRARVPGVIVGGLQLPFLAEMVDDAFHGLPFAVALVDSSYTPAGIIGAGGLLRVEDLLELANELSLRVGAEERPLLLLTHHHLIPTPVTDTARIDADTTNPALRWLAKHALAGLIPYADHEEWMMTALGAGSALTTLQAFGRPIFVLHGHKHYPTVRVLRASLVGQGDVVLLSAGSAGLALPLDDGDEDDVARLWPSFHVLEIDGTAVRVETIAYYGDASPASRELLRVEADGAAWRVEQTDDNINHRSPTLSYNRSEATLRQSAAREDARWDIECVRSILALSPVDYREHLRAAPGARFVASGTVSGEAANRSIEIPTDGTHLRYFLLGGAVRSVREALRAYGPVDPFEGVELLCRYESAEARLTLRGLPASTRPFGSTVDLTRGRAMPQPLVRRDDGSVEMIVTPCPPRTQLRIQWRPER